eukprot:SAG22_NODE_15706_length_342_cov_1.683128_1_plen_36_part_00
MYLGGDQSEFSEVAATVAAEPLRATCILNLKIQVW